MAQDLPPGAPVHVFWADGGRAGAVAGEIAAPRHPDGTFDVLLDDGTRERTANVVPLVSAGTPVRVPARFLGPLLREYRVTTRDGQTVAARAVRPPVETRSGLAVGDAVFATYMSPTTFYAGTVTGVNDGTYAIDFDDGDDADSVPRASIVRPLAGAVPEPGDSVLWLSENGGSGYLGVLERVQDGVADVGELMDYGSERTEFGVPLARLRLVDCGRKAMTTGASLEVGDAVVALLQDGDSEWVPATVEGWTLPDSFVESSVAGLHASGAFECANVAEPVPLHCLQVPPVPLPPLLGETGVTARWKTSSKQYAAVIRARNDDGTFQVLYEDGDFDARVPAANVTMLGLGLEPNSAVEARLAGERRWRPALLLDGMSVALADGSRRDDVVGVRPVPDLAGGGGGGGALGLIGRRVRVHMPDKDWHEHSGVVSGDDQVLLDSCRVLDAVSPAQLSEFPADDFDPVVDALGDDGGLDVLPAGTIVRVSGLDTVGVVSRQRADFTYEIEVASTSLQRKPPVTLRRPDLLRLASGAALEREPLRVGDAVDVWDVERGAWRPGGPFRVLEAALLEYVVDGGVGPTARLVLRRCGEGRDGGPPQLLPPDFRERLLAAWTAACRAAGDYAVSAAAVRACLADPADVELAQSTLGPALPLYCQALCPSMADAALDHVMLRPPFLTMLVDGAGGPVVPVRDLRRALEFSRVPAKAQQQLVERFDPLELDVVPADAVLCWCFPESPQAAERLRAQLGALLPHGLQQALERIADRQGAFDDHALRLALHCFGAVVRPRELQALPKTVRGFVRWVRDAPPGSGRCRIADGELLLELATAGPAAVAAHVTAAGANLAAVAFDEAAALSGKELRALVPLLPASLRVLRLVGCPVRDSGLAALAPRLPSLEVLQLDCRCTITAAGARALPGSLTELDAAGCAWGAEGARELCALQRLRRLRLVDCGLDSDTVRALCDGLPALEALDVTDAILDSSDGPLRGLTSLRVCVDGPRLALALDGTLQSLHVLRSPEKLELTGLSSSALRELRLLSVSLSADALVGLVAALPALRELELARCALDQAAVAALAPLDEFSACGGGREALDLAPLAGLRVLTITDHGPLVLGAAYPRLTALDLSRGVVSTPVADVDFPLLERLRVDAVPQRLPPRLRHLDVPPGLSAPLGALQSRYPAVQVYGPNQKPLVVARNAARAARQLAVARRWALILAWRARGSALAVMPVAGVRGVVGFL